MKPVAVVLNGTSSAGKSSIARALQRLSTNPVLHVSLDTFTEMFHWPSIPYEATRRECHVAGIANLHASLAIMASGPYPIAVDHVFEEHSWFEACREALKEKPTYFVGVHCPLEVLEQRELSRGDRRIGLARWQFDRVHLQKPYSFEVDTSVHSPEECAAAIIDFIAKEERQ